MMARPRLILPASLRGPLRVTPDLPAVHGSARPRRGGKLGLLLLWGGLCAGLYLIGNLPRARPSTIPSSTSQHATAPSTQSGAPIPTTTLPLTSPVSAGGSAPSATAATGPLRHELKPLRDKSNLAVFGTGLERPADLGGPDLGSADLSNPDVPGLDPPSPDLQGSADRTSPED
ncbi:MAG TPA: hypothetical protein VHO25_04485 [Polyangiaceae bacterium]|nr:hypothetical protein [Polyangiaceae bacterium]